jgi:hypothetical protein
MEQQIDESASPFPTGESTETPKGNYAPVRYNAVKHGVLSTRVVLPHEDEGEFSALLAELVQEHQPSGPTELHLVEELAAIMWRKKRILLAECAKINQSIRVSLHGLDGKPSSTVKNAVPTDAALAGAYVDYRDLMSTTRQDLQVRELEALADLEATEKADQILQDNKTNAYKKALKTLLPESQHWWQDQLDDEEVEATAESLQYFILNDLLPTCRSTLAEIRHHEAIKRQVIGEGVYEPNMENLSRYETHLDRKFERTLAMLVKLKELRSRE